MHRSLFLGYYEDGVCKREEGVLLNEVEYEQRRMTDAIVAMLKKLTEYRPILIVINRFQLVGRSSMELIYRLVTDPSSKIGIVLGVNEMQPRLDTANDVWDAIVGKNLKTAARSITSEVPESTETGRRQRILQRIKTMHICSEK